MVILIIGRGWRPRDEGGHRSRDTARTLITVAQAPPLASGIGACRVSLGKENQGSSDTSEKEKEEEKRRWNHDVLHEISSAI